MSVKPVDLNKLRSTHENLYETVVAISKKARDIHDEERAELEERLMPYKEMIRNPTSESESEKVFPEQIAISVEFECRDKPALQAVAQFFEEKYDYILEKSSENKVTDAEDDDEAHGD
ncbi:MAG: hypothetical protein HGB29_07570 [Chlorobiaceae bacterium]|nr:hypothetical protein [Chlorobiaceae bacterium]NTW74705.1 hypothetical protein [Chlorobiaceae bacterium]